MCGLIAVTGPGSAWRVEKGIKSLRHRGVRAKIVDGPGWAMAHTRLPIVGTGPENDQPVQRNSWVIGFVGEVLDFRDYRPGADCDLDLVVDTWANDGPAGFGQFDGFWSVVAYDWRDGALHALCDYLSQKPLYYLDRDGVQVVASEPDAVIAAWGNPHLPLDEIYLSAVIKWGYCPETWRTPYRGVRRLGPGEYVALGGWLKVVDPLSPAPLTDDDLKKEIEQAVRRRVESSDVPVACLVSGGLDSAITYTLARRYGDVRAYHVLNSEADACRKVAPDATTLDCHDVTLEQGLRYMQEPLDLGSLLPQVALSDAIARAGGESVCLTGDGADEFFGGYGRALRYDSQASDVWHELVAWHLPRLDRVMMRNRVEVRNPFLARRVAAAALSLPYTRRRDKAALRDFFRGDLPLGVADTPKRPLRTGVVESNREKRSLDLVNLFRGEYAEVG